MKKEAMLYERLEAKKVHCYLCSHHCRILPSQSGICAVRENREGTLYTLVYAEPVAANADPIEKKPLYHFFPASTSYSIATAGCNFKCDFCQNWQISQTSGKRTNISLAGLKPEDILRQAQRLNCKSISYTYTEPTIFFEYAYDTAKLAKQSGIYNNFVTNGYMSPQALKVINPYLDAANVDLKSFSDDFYRRICRARLSYVLDTIRLMKELNIWIEITTLVVPGLNDSEKELRSIADFIVSVGVQIPWHISRFHPNYKMMGVHAQATPIETLRKAKEIGEEAGLRYVYLGNVFEGNNTYCYNCKSLLIARDGLTLSSTIVVDGNCPTCHTPLDGVFT